MIKRFKNLNYFAINFVLLLTLSSCSYDKTVVTIGSAFDNTWSFNSAEGYDFDENLVEVKNGFAQLKPLDLEHSGADFNNGNHVGSQHYGSGSTLKISESTNPSLDVRVILPDSVDNLVSYWKFEGSLNNEIHSNILSADTAANLSSEFKIGNGSYEFITDDSNVENLAVMMPQENLNERQSLTISFWFKAVGTQDDWAQFFYKDESYNVHTTPGWGMQRHNNTDNYSVDIENGSIKNRRTGGGISF